MTVAVPAVAIEDAGMSAVRLEAELKVVVTFTPLKRACAIASKVPLIVSWKPIPPAKVRLGDKVVITGAGNVTVKVWLPLVPPPGLALMTEMSMLPVAASIADGTTAERDVESLNVVDSAMRFARTMEALTKPVPVTVMVTSAPPRSAELGDTPEIVGEGLVIVNGKVPLSTPPGFRTATVAVRAFASWLAGT